MASLGEDLRAFLAGLGHVAHGVDAVEGAASSAAQKLKGLPDRVEAIGDSFDRVLEASLAAGIAAGAQALQGELQRPRVAGGPKAAELPMGVSNPVSSPGRRPWKPSPGCIHDGTCKGPNPWACHADIPRKHPQGKIGPKGETELYCCGCAPCHPKPTTKAVPSPASTASPTSGAVDERLSRLRVTPEAAPSSPTGSTSCEKHGVCSWNGHLICGNCRRIYQASNPKAERFAPDVCACSANLRPREREPFAGRPLCHLCYLAHRSFGRMA